MTTPISSRAVSEDEWIDLESAAHFLGLTPKLMRTVVVEKQLEVRRFPLRIRQSDLQGCLERCRVQPGALAHLDSNATRRADPHRPVPLTRKGRPDRRYGPR